MSENAQPEQMTITEPEWTPWLDAPTLSQWVGCSASALRKWTRSSAEGFGRRYQRRPRGSRAPGKHKFEYRASLRRAERWAEPSSAVGAPAPRAPAPPSPDPFLTPPPEPVEITDRMRVRVLVDMQLERTGKTDDQDARAALWRRLYDLFYVVHGRRIPRSHQLKTTRLEHVCAVMGMGAELYALAYYLWAGEASA